MSTRHRDPHHEVSRRQALQLAAAAQCDVRTAIVALAEGPHAVRGLMLRERLQTAMGELSLASRSGARIGD